MPGRGLPADSAQALTHAGRLVGNRSARAAAGLALAVLLLALFAYWPVRDNGFVLFDDEDYITRNEVVKRGLTPQGVVLAFTRSYVANWHPLTWISHMVDVELFGLDPRGHHLAGLAIHLATALLLLLTLRAMTGRAGPSFVVAALFAVHPLHVESVAWAAERKDVLCAFFWVLTTALYLRYARRPGPGRFLPVLLCFALGLMAKQMLVTLPFVLLLLDYWPLGRPGMLAAPTAARARTRLAALALEKLPLLGLAALAGLLTLRAQSSIGLVHSLKTFPLEARVANAILTPLRYLGKTIWPADLAIFYPYAAHPIGDPRVLAAGAALLAAGAGVVIARRRHPWLLTGWLWYLVTLLPVLGLIQVGDQALADRYTYLPLIGIFIAASWAAAAAGRRRPAARCALAAGAVLGLLLLAGLARRQVAVWHDDRSLFGHALRVTKDNWLAAYLMGVSLEREGDAAGAQQRFRETIRINAGYEQVRIALAGLLRREGRPAEAIGELRAAVAAIPGSQRLRVALALALRGEGSPDEAIESLRAGVAAIPDDRDLRMLLALTLADAGREPEAIAELRGTIRLWPGYTLPYNSLAALLARRGEVEEAMALLRRALEIDPGYEDARLNLEALARARATGDGTGPAPAPP